MDTFSKSKRSEIMSKVSGKDTKPEILVRKYLFSKGFRFRKNVANLPGKPDIVLPKYKTVIFIHGCFWHGHKNCEAAKLPTSNIDYWTKKISSNIKRDLKNEESLKIAGWNVIFIWECELKAGNKEKKLNLLVSQLHKKSLN
ncbi:MAG: DNA mismatch endonuclease Vsr [Chitinispirillales bacterium]|jgi:DNA mismatch endonuclease (patch repair protein)|nr:DNA mismatch endonuclease Vsr [Chitinispirillales bacterium]